MPPEVAPRRASRCKDEGWPWGGQDQLCGDCMCHSLVAFIRTQWEAALFLSSYSQDPSPGKGQELPGEEASQRDGQSRACSRKALGELGGMLCLQGDTSCFHRKQSHPSMQEGGLLDSGPSTAPYLEEIIPLLLNTNPKTNTTRLFGKNQEHERQVR